MDVQCANFDIHLNMNLHMIVWMCIQKYACAIWMCRQKCAFSCVGGSSKNCALACVDVHQ